MVYLLVIGWFLATISAVLCAVQAFKMKWYIACGLDIGIALFDLAACIGMTVGYLIN